MAQATRARAPKRKAIPASQIDPGREGALKLLHEGSPARLNVGDAVLEFYGNNECGIPARISRGYGLYSVDHPDGVFIRTDGTRMSWLYGYAIRRDDDGSESFCFAHCLTRHDCRPTHLVLVS